MKNKKLLAIILLSLSFCFVSGAQYGVGSEKDSVSVPQTWAEVLEADIQESRAPERYTFLVVIKYDLPPLIVPLVKLESME